MKSTLQQDSAMRLNPQQAPLHGECVLTVQLDDDDMCRAEEEEEEEESIEFYLLFSGSTQKHLTSTLRVSHVTLQAVCPAHDVCEEVSVTLCLGRPGGQVKTRSQETFCFVKDSAVNMAHCLLNETPPQETLQLDNMQCERSDRSPAPAQVPLSLTHQETAHVDGLLDNQTLTVRETEVHTRSDTNGHNADTHKETWPDGSTRLQAPSQCQEAAADGHCVTTPTQDVLQDPGGGEVLRTPHLPGQTPARQPESRGQALVDVLTQHDTSSSNVQVEPKGRQHFNQKGRVFQHHPHLGTYTQTFPSLADPHCCLQEEVAELRRLIHLHRAKMEHLDCPGAMATIHTSTSLCIDNEAVGSTCGPRPGVNSRQGNEQDTSLTAVTMKICSATKKQQESSLSLDERTQGEDCAPVTHTSCTSGSLCQSQEAGREQRGTPAAKNKSKSNRKNQKRTTKTPRRAAENLRNETVTPEAGGVTAPRPKKTAGSRAETDGTVSAVSEPTVAAVSGERGATLTQCGPTIKKAPLPVKSVSASGGDGKCAGRKAVALPTTTTVEKQEGEKWEVDLLMCEGVTKTETAAETEQGDAESLHDKEAPFNLALEPAAQRTVTMGQEQSQDHQKSQADPDDPCQPDNMNKSPESGRSPKFLHTERKPRKPLRQDGSWSRSRTGSPPHGPESVAKTVWYQGENLGQVVGEDLSRQELSSQSVWYYSDTVGQRKPEQLEQRMGEKKECGLSSPQAPSSVQLLEQVVVSSYQPSVALSQPHAAGTQPALSHGPATQRQEVCELQQEEEVVPDWKEEGVEGDREEIKHRERTYSRESSETAGIDARGEEKQGHKENGTKGNRKKRKKKGKRGNAESQSQKEIRTKGDETELNIQSETESEATDRTGATDIHSVRRPQPTEREHAHQDPLHLPSETQGRAGDGHGLDDGVTNLDPGYSTLEINPVADRTTDLTEVSASPTAETKGSSEDKSMNFLQPVDCNPLSSVATSELHKSDVSEAGTEGITTVGRKEKELLDPTDLDFKCISNPGNAVASKDQSDLVECVFPKELPFQNRDPKEFIEDYLLTEFPEQNTQHVGVQSTDSNKPVQPVDPLGRSIGFMESVHPTGAGDLTFESIVDMSPLHKGERRAETTTRDYLEPGSETLRRLQHKEERPDSCVGEEEVCTESRWGRSEGNDSGTVYGNKSSFIDGGENVEEEELPSSDREEEQRHSEELVATAVAIVTVAIASAISIELGRQPLAQDADLAPHTLSRCTDDLVNAVQPVRESAQLTDKEIREVLATTEREKQPVENSHVEPPNQFNSKPRANVKPSEEAQQETQTETQLASELSSNQQANLSPAVPAKHLQLDREEIQTESPQNKLFTLCRNVPNEKDKQLQMMKPMLEASEIITGEIDGQRTTQQEESAHSCPVVDTGQHPDVSDTSCPDSHEDPQQEDQSICQKESRVQEDSGRPQLDLRFQHNQTLDKDESHLVESVIAEAEVGREAETSESREKGFSEPTGSHSQAGKRGEGSTLSVSCSSTLPFTRSTPDPDPEEPAAPVNVGTGESAQSGAGMEPVGALPPAHAALQTKGQESAAVENEDVFQRLHQDSDTFDTVDGWKERERKMMKNEEGARKEMVTVKDTAHTEAETFQAGKEECSRTRTDSDSTHTVQIQSEKDVFYPVQPYCQSNTEATDIYPDNEECVSVCLLHRDIDGRDFSPKLEDNVFKKPEDPPACEPHSGAHVSWSSTDDGLAQRAPSPPEGPLSVGGPDAVAPLSSRMSWRSDTEDRGGGETEAGKEEEKRDQLPENLLSSAILRASTHSLSPHRRHSWEPGRNNAAADHDIIQRSSLKSLSGEAKRAKPPLHRRSMSWCPSNLLCPGPEHIDNRSYSLEGLEVERTAVQAGGPYPRDGKEGPTGRNSHLVSQERGSLVSLTEEDSERYGSSAEVQKPHQVLSGTISCPAMFHHQALTKSISMVTISHRDIDVVSSLSSNSGSLEYSISEEPGPLRSDTEGKGGPKISRTFSYLRSKMSKKGREKERKGERERENKEREKKSVNGHLFVAVSPSPSTACQHCTKLLYNKESFFCNNCGVQVHKCCRESLSVCTKSKSKPPVPEAVPGSAVNMRSKSTSSTSSVSSTSSSSSRERWSTATTPDDQLTVVFPRRHPSIFNQNNSLAKSISTSNIAGLDDVPLKGLKFLSQSTDSLHQGGKVSASTESLCDEGTEMLDSQLMGEFEYDIKDLEADSWSSTVDKKFLKVLKKDEIKKQDVIYELYQTEFHHVRTLKIMSEVYYKGLQKELQLDTQTLDKIFPVMDNLLDIHTHFLTLLLDKKRASSTDGQNNSFLICSIGDVLVQQFTGCSADRMKKAYGKFCSRHNEAVSLYKDLHSKDKRFQNFIKRTMASNLVRRLSIPECILLVTQRITKYPVLIQRILQLTKDSDEDHSCVCEALRCVKELILAVDNKVNEQEKKQRLMEVYSRTDSKSIMRMKSGQMFAKEDLIRGRKLLHDGALQLKNSTGRLKDVHAMLLSDVLLFLQEKDQKYVFASLDQRSTVISLHNLIVREVANEERGLFLITAGIERPEMVEVLASSKEERNTWRAIIQDAMHCMEKDEDEGVPSETEEDRRQHENRARQIRELLRRKDEQILSLLEEKVHIFRELSDCNPAPDHTNAPVRERMIFRATADDVTKGEPIIKDALKEVETLHALVSSGVGGAGCSVPVCMTGASVGPVCLPRRAETFGGFDSHQMNSNKNGEKEEGDESLDLRRTESDSVLKKGAAASLQILLKRNNEQVQHSVAHLHDLLISLQAVVVQQDSFIDDQRQALSERLTATSSRNSSSSSLSSSSSSRPSSLIEQEKHRSLERQRQEAASLQKQQVVHQEEKRRREKAWEFKEKCLAEWEERLRVEEEETRRRCQELNEEKEAMQRKKEEYQRELERLREAQRRLERDKEALTRDTERLEAMRSNKWEQLHTPSTTSKESIKFHSTTSLDLDSKEAAEEVELSSSAPTKEPFLRIGSKRMGKGFNPFSSSSSSKPQGVEKEPQLPSRLLQLAKPKDKTDKKKKKWKGGEQAQTENKEILDAQSDGDIFFC